MYQIGASHPMLVGKYHDVYGPVVGKTFGMTTQAEGFLTDNGWQPDPFGTVEWVKDGPTSMCGQIGVSMVHYVKVFEL